LPAKAAATPRPERKGLVFVLERPDGAVWLQRRPDEGLLGGLLLPPSTPWREASWKRAEAMTYAPKGVTWRHAGRVRHVFTHFALEVEIYRGLAGTFLPNDGLWAAPEDFKGLALSTLARKILAQATDIKPPGKSPARQAR
jgi:A/G-specific adenine glycosylase